MLQVLGAVVAGLAGLAWLSAAVHSLLLLSHRAEEHSLLGLMFNGWRFYSRDTFKPSGWPLHRRFLMSVGAFFGLVLLTIVLGAVGTL